MKPTQVPDGYAYTGTGAHGRCLNGWKTGRRGDEAGNGFNGWMGQGEGLRAMQPEGMDGDRLVSDSGRMDVSRR